MRSETKHTFFIETLPALMQRSWHHGLSQMEDIWPQGRPHRVDREYVEHVVGPTTTNEAIELLAARAVDAWTLQSLAHRMVDINWLSSSTNIHFDHWVLYLHKRRCWSIPKTCVQVTSLYQRVDPRIWDHIYSTRPSPPVAADAMPAGPPGDILEVGGYCFPVHLKHIIKASDVLQALTSHNSGFKAVYDPGARVLRLRLDAGIPEDIGDMRLTVSNWIHHCHTGHLNPCLLLEEIVDVQSLAAYLLDNTCLAHTHAWMVEHYLQNFESHNNCGEECLVCTYWHNTK